MQSHFSGMPIKRSAYSLIAIQSVIALIIVVLMAIVGGWQDSLSALIAGVICVVANSYFAKRIFRHQGAQNVKKFIRAYFLGELTKLGIIIVLMLLALTLLKIKAMPFLLTFIVLQLAMSFIPIVTEKAKFMSSINSDIQSMATEKNEGISDHISSFSQGDID